MKRVLTALLSLVMCGVLVLSLMVMPSVAEESKNYNLTGETSRASEEIALSDGTGTGVTLTNIQLSGHYGDNREVNVAEFDLSNTHLSVEVINSGTYMVSAQTMTKAIDAYNQSHEGQQVLAAINGDLWMTSVHSGSSVTKSVLQVPRGVLIIDGEIWASQQIDQENLGATNAEKGTPAGLKSAFGVTTQNQPLVGSPNIRVTLDVGGKKIVTNGINRLPAQNALIVYNHRVNDTNYALNDAYEVELEVADSSAFKAGGEITATVKAIYKTGANTRPALDNPKTIVLTARGNRVADLQNNFSVGDTVTLTTTLTDAAGRTDLWQDVVDAIGGHMQVLQDGKIAVANGDTTAYPTALIGYKDDGNVMLLTVTSTLDGSRAALRFSQSLQFCKEMGYNSVFYLDGGGSTTFVALEEGSYTIRNKCSDGSPRAVINGVAVVWNDTPVCEKQGSLSYIEVPVDMSIIPPTYMDGALIEEMISSPVNVTTAYDAEEKAFAMTTDKATNDPYASLDFSSLMRVNAEDYPYMVFKVKSTHTAPTTFMLFYACGAHSGADDSRTKSFRVDTSEEWQYITVDMSKVSAWKGTINSLRLDIFDSVTTPADTTMYIGAIVLCQTAEEASQVAEGWTPEGAVTDYLAYLESMKPEPETEPETEPITEPETEPVTEAVVPDTEAETQVATEAVVTEAEQTQAGTSAPEETEAVASSGCSSVMTLALPALTLAVLGVAVIKKKKD